MMYVSSVGAKMSASGSIFKSAYLNPSVTPPPMMPQPTIAQPVPGQSSMAQPVPGQPSMAQQTGISESILFAANNELQSKLSKANERIKSLESEQAGLIDRLEKSLVIASRLKNVEIENNGLKDKYATSERELRSLFLRNKELEQQAADRGNQLTDVRNKYFAERQRSDAVTSQLDHVKTASELAKRELDNQVEKTHLREIQISTLRNLTGHLPPSSGPSKSLNYDDELNMASSSEAVLGSHPLKPTTWKEWQLTPIVSDKRNISEHTRRLLLSPNFVGTLFEDKAVRFTVSVSINAGTALIDFALLNLSPASIQSVNLLNATRANSYFDFAVEQAGSENFLRPGQHVPYRAEMRLLGVFDYQTVQPTVCITYTQAGDVPKSIYVGIPLHVVKFASPVSPDASVLMSRWTACSDNEHTCQVRVVRDELKSFASLVTVSELGSRLMAIKGIDPNPRGQIFTASIFGEKEIMARLELTPADHRGPPMIRITVRSSSLSLSKSVASSLIDVLA